MKTGRITYLIYGLDFVLAFIMFYCWVTYDRSSGTAFYQTEIFHDGAPLDVTGGSPVLYQHVFWFLGHPLIAVLVFTFLFLLMAFLIKKYLISSPRIENKRIKLWLFISLVPLVFSAINHIYVYQMIMDQIDEFDSYFIINPLTPFDLIAGLISLSICLVGLIQIAKNIKWGLVVFLLGLIGVISIYFYHPLFGFDFILS